MVQHQALVGDTLDDYCPHDNEVTTHIVVATSGDSASVTRCQSCDEEHSYFGTEEQGNNGTGDRVSGDGPVGRPLIRASLPHPDGAGSPPREAPVFTMHEQPARGNNWGKQGGRNGATGNLKQKKHGRHRSSQGRKFNDTQNSGNQSGNRTNGNQAIPEGRSGSKSRSARRGRGRSR